MSDNPSYFYKGIIDPIYSSGGCTGQLPVAAEGGTVVQWGSADAGVSTAQNSICLDSGDKVSYQGNRFMHVGSNTAYLEYLESNGIFGSNNSGLVASSYVDGSRASIVFGGVATDFTLLDADMKILHGGTAINTTISSGSVQILSGAAMSGAEMHENVDNLIYVADGAYLADAVVNAGSVYVEKGGEAFNVKIGRMCSLVAQGTCSRATVKSAGILRTDGAFGTLHDVRVEYGGSLQGAQQHGETSAFAYVEKVSGGTFHGLVTDLVYTGSAQAGSTAQVKNLTLMKNAQFSAFDGAAVSAATINNGGVMTLTRDAVAYGLDVANGGSVILAAGASAINTALQDGAEMSAGAETEIKNITVAAGAALSVSGYKATLTGNIDLLSDADKIGVFTVDGDIDAAGAVISIDLTTRSTENTVCQISNFNVLSEATITVNLSKTQGEGTYLLGANGVNFGGSVTIMNGVTRVGDLTFAQDLMVDDVIYSFTTDGFGKLYLNVDVVPETNLTGSDNSQIVVWNSAEGKVGYISQSGTEVKDVYGWSDAEVAIWNVEGVGRFKGAAAANDGILIYNNDTNTYGVWTDLDDPEMGYVALARVDGKCETIGFANLNGNGYDDILVRTEDGSFGVLVDGADWQKISSDSTLELIGGGDFGAADGMDSLLVRKDDSYSLWHQNGGAWTETVIGTSDWTVAGIGDFQNDGTDDIVLWNKDTGEVCVWEDGDSTNVRNAGILDANFWEIAAVGDYNGDKKDDLLIRELVSGQGRLAYWGAGSEASWTDLNSKADSNKFAVIA